MEPEVDEIFEDSGKKYKCVRDLNGVSCKICKLNGSDLCLSMLCAKADRIDGFSVHFEDVEDGEA